MFSIYHMINNFSGPEIHQQREQSIVRISYYWPKYLEK